MQDRKSGRLKTAEGYYVFSRLDIFEQLYPHLGGKRNQSEPSNQLKDHTFKPLYFYTFIPNADVSLSNYFSQPVGLIFIIIIGVLVTFTGFVLLAYGRDETRHRAFVKRTSSELEDLYNNAPCGYHSFDSNMVVTRINDTELDWLGYTREEIEGKVKFPELITAESRNKFFACFEDFRKTGHVNDILLDLQSKEGGTIPVIASATAIIDEKGGFVASRCTLFNYTERKQLEAKLLKSATQDTLTGLFRRSYFEEVLSKEFARLVRSTGSVMVMILDIDYFKSINDTFGHDGGDKALIEFSNRLKQALRQDDVAARYGGEEFALLLANTTFGEALEIAERIREDMSRTPMVLSPGRELQLTVSIGVTQLASSDSHWSEAMRRADEALYEAKAEGRNKVKSIKPLN